MRVETDWKPNVSQSRLGDVFAIKINRAKKRIERFDKSQNRSIDIKIDRGILY